MYEFMVPDTDGRTVWVQIEEPDDSPNPFEVVIRKYRMGPDGVHKFQVQRRMSFPTFEQTLATFGSFFKFYALGEGRDEPVEAISLG